LNDASNSVADLALRGATTVFRNSSSETLRVDSSGRLLHGTSIAGTGAFGTVPFFHTASSGSTNTFQNFGATTYPARIDLAKTRGASANSHTVVQSGDTIGGIYFAGSDGTDYAQAAQIEVFVDGTPGDNDMPGRIVFSTTADSAGTVTERLRITSGGAILPGADNTQDLGSSAKRFANIYTGDLNLSNEGSTNDVDGTWGNYTIQEGEDDLFLINRRTGKKYKFNLTEVN